MLLISSIIILSLSLIALIVLTVFAFKIKKAYDALDDLIMRYLKHNQGFYKSQENILKDEKEIQTLSSKNLNETETLKKHISRLEQTVKTTSTEIIDLKNIINNVESNVKATERIINNLANFSNNLKIINTIASDLKEAIRQSKKGN